MTLAVEIKDDVLRLASPAYPLIGVLRKLGCVDVYLSIPFDEDLVYAIWRSTEKNRYMIMWRGKTTMPYTAIRKFIDANKGRLVNTYQVAYPGEGVLNGQAVEFTCPCAGFDEKEPITTVNWNMKDIVRNENRRREEVCA
jgi:hypothetical protein